MLAGLLVGAGSALAATPMTAAQFDAFLETATSELDAKQHRLSVEYDLAAAESWWFDQATGKLQFFDDRQHLMVEAEIIDAGSYSPKSNSWKWAWGNDSVLPALRKKAEKLKELQATTGLELFGEPGAFEVEGEDRAWELAAMAVKHLGAMGVYRAPSEDDGPVLFLLIMKIRTFQH